jgi:F-type H+-transporting ATPase subunit a
MESFLRIKRNIIPVESETIFSIGSFPVTNSSLMLVVVLCVVAITGILLTRWLKLNPGRFQNVLELLYEKVLGAVTGITGSKERAEKIFPLIGAIFVFIILSNALLFIPGLSSLTFHDKNIFRTATSDFNTTFGLAVAMALFIQYINIKEVGIFEYLGKFFQFHLVYKGFKQGIGQGFVSIINFLIGLLDIVSEFAKVVSLSLRLFGNMFAGEVLAIVIIGGLAFGLPAIWMSMNLLAAVVQTLVFSFLVTAYYTMALKPEEKGAVIKDENPEKIIS